MSAPSPLYGWGYEPAAAKYHRVIGGPDRAAMSYLCGTRGPTARAHVAPTKAGLPNDGFGGHGCPGCHDRFKTLYPGESWR